MHPAPPPPRWVVRVCPRRLGCRVSGSCHRRTGGFAGLRRRLGACMRMRSSSSVGCLSDSRVSRWNLQKGGSHVPSVLGSLGARPAGVDAGDNRTALLRRGAEILSMSLAHLRMPSTIGRRPGTGDVYPSRVRLLKSQFVQVLLALLEGRQDKRTTGALRVRPRRARTPCGVGAADLGSSTPYRPQVDAGSTPDVLLVCPRSTSDRRQIDP